MKSNAYYLLASISVGALVLMSSGAAVAGNPLNYLTGPYLIWDFTETLNVTFDGAGNYNGTATVNGGPDEPVCAIDTSGTYTAAADGTISVVYSIYHTQYNAGCVPVVIPGQIATGNLSPDGNTLVLNNLASGQTGDDLLGIKLGGIINENYGAGVMALSADTTGTGNTAAGDFALQANLSGSNNTAFGYNALYSNTSGKGNAAQGVNALYNNSTGIRNLGIGSNALYTNSTGSYNIALGFDAGYNVNAGSNNIEIGTQGTASDNNTIQIGVQGTQTATTIAGIYGTPITGSAVYVTSTGQLGVQGSSERFKTDIAPMPEFSEKLSLLRPVTFQYKTDPTGTRQYGLIAEEVDKVYPELVIRDSTGAIQGVHYEELAPMLLNEVQEQQHTIAAQEAALRELTQQLEQLAAREDRYSDMQHQLDEMHALFLKLKTVDDSMVHR